MPSTDVYALQKSNLNVFLFADVGVEASGLTLSVFSTLAREGLDPWQEARRLAGLPRDAAVEGLARTIAAMPASSWQLPDARAIASRLVALLPMRGGGPTFVFSPKPASALTRQWTVVLMLLAMMLFGLTLNFL